MSEWAESIAAGDLRALARAATAVENRLPEAQTLLKELFPRTGRATIIGVTGSPGAGKSTLCDRMLTELRSDGRKVGVIAVDPTSPYTGGAILGDRIRMQGHYADAGVFIRSMATRGWLGGLASATTDMALLLDAAGRDVVLVETVGVGQDEVEVARLADVTIVVLVPGMGDDVQAIKAGILEIADVFAINKSDQPGAEKLESEIKMVQSLSTRKDGWVPPIVRTVASEGIGITETLAAARKYLEHGGRADRSASIWALRLRDMLRERLLDRFSQADIEHAAVDVAARRTNPYTVVEQWMESLTNVRIQD
jgi:LAO/AO transport system kinase